MQDLAVICEAEMDLHWLSVFVAMVESDTIMVRSQIIQIEGDRRF